VPSRRHANIVITRKQSFSPRPLLVGESKEWVSAEIFIHPTGLKRATDRNRHRSKPSRHIPCVARNRHAHCGLGLARRRRRILLLTANSGVRGPRPRVSHQNGRLRNPCVTLSNHRLGFLSERWFATVAADSPVEIRAVGPKRRG
jgi:hypothetical protein